MNDVDLIQMRREWYDQTFVLFEIAKCTKDRELAFIGVKPNTENLPVIRCCKAFAIDYLKSNFEKFRFYQRNFNAFTSISTFNNFPMFSFNPSVRKEELKAFFQLGGFDSCWAGIDFVLDLDNEDLKKAYSDAVKTKKVLDEFRVPYSIRFSGNRGFHFVVADRDFFPRDMKNIEKITISRIIAENLREIENIQSIDVGIYDKERLLKCPFTLVNENVCLPLSDKEFENWSIEKMHWKYVQDNYVLKNRGLLARDKIINWEELIDIYGNSYE